VSSSKALALMIFEVYGGGADAETPLFVVFWTAMLFPASWFSSQGTPRKFTAAQQGPLPKMPSICLSVPVHDFGFGLVLVPQADVAEIPGDEPLSVTVLKQTCRATLSELEPGPSTTPRSHNLRGRSPESP